MIIGNRWIIKDHDLQFSCNVKYYLLFICPELLIYIDSQAAIIDGINYIFDAAYRNSKKFLKLNNYIILATIQDLIKMKSLKLILIKIWEHFSDK